MDTIIKSKSLKGSNMIYPISFLLTTTLIIVGCSKAPKPVQTTQKQSTKTQAKQTGISLSKLKKRGALNSLKFKAKKSYALNESIQFVIDTGAKEGYLYLIYLDNAGETGLLYPNANAPLSEMGGKFTFPKDFGNMNIRATKDCKDCSEEKTTIYALLSKSPIIDIKNITKTDLLELTSPQSKDRAISLELTNNNKDQSNFNVGTIDFFVK